MGRWPGVLHFLGSDRRFLRPDVPSRPALAGRRRLPRSSTEGSGARTLLDLVEVHQWPVHARTGRLRAVAQLARVPVSKTGGWGFESLLPCEYGPRLAG